MSQHKCWSLFNKEEKLRIDDLTIDQVRTILLAIASARMRDWYACREGDVHWQALADIPDFYEDVHADKGAPAAVAAAEKAVAPKIEPASKAPSSARRPLFEDLPSDRGTEPTLNVESTQTKERRTARRYARHLVFRTSVSGTVFESKTQDISMSGLALTDPLPSSIGKNFRAELSLNGQSLIIACSRVTDTQLKILEAEAWDILRQWIANW